MRHKHHNNHHIDHVDNEHLQHDEHDDEHKYRDHIGRADDNRRRADDNRRRAGEHPQLHINHIDHIDIVDHVDHEHICGADNHSKHNVHDHERNLVCYVLRIDGVNNILGANFQLVQHHIHHIHKQHKQHNHKHRCPDGDEYDAAKHTNDIGINTIHVAVHNGIDTVHVAVHNGIVTVHFTIKHGHNNNDFVVVVCRSTVP